MAKQKWLAVVEVLVTFETPTARVPSKKTIENTVYSLLKQGDWKDMIVMEFGPEEMEE